MSSMLFRKCKKKKEKRKTFQCVGCWTSRWRFFSLFGNKKQLVVSLREVESLIILTICDDANMFQLVSDIVPSHRYNKSSFIKFSFKEGGVLLDIFSVESIVGDMIVS